MTTTLFGTTTCEPCGRTRPAGHLLDMERRLTEALTDLLRDASDSWDAVASSIYPSHDDPDYTDEQLAHVNTVMANALIPEGVHRLVRMVDVYASHDGANTDTVQQLRRTIARDLLGTDTTTTSTGGTAA